MSRKGMEDTAISWIYPVSDTEIDKFHKKELCRRGIKYTVVFSASRSRPSRKSGGFCQEMNRRWSMSERTGLHDISLSHRMQVH